MLGLAHDLYRPRPEICLRLSLGRAEAQATATPEDGEFDELRFVPAVAQLGDFLTSNDGSTVTPAGAGALALFLMSKEARQTASDRSSVHLLANLTARSLRVDC